MEEMGPTLHFAILAKIVPIAENGARRIEWMLFAAMSVNFPTMVIVTTEVLDRILMHANTAQIVVTAARGRRVAVVPSKRLRTAAGRNLLVLRQNWLQPIALALSLVRRRSLLEWHSMVGTWHGHFQSARVSHSPCKRYGE
jgi:hypothetical protein